MEQVIPLNHRHARAGAGRVNRYSMLYDSVNLPGTAEEKKDGG